MNKLALILFASLAVSNFNVHAMDDELEPKEKKTVVVIKKKKSNKLAIFLGLVGLGLGIAAIIMAAKSRQPESFVQKGWRGFRGFFNKIDKKTDEIYDNVPGMKTFEGIVNGPEAEATMPPSKEEKEERLAQDKATADKRTQSFLRRLSGNGKRK